MIHPVRFLFASVFALAFAACGGESSVKPTECPASQVCGKECCSTGETCIADVCEPEVQCALDSELADFSALDGTADWAPQIGQSRVAFLSAELPTGDAAVRLFLRDGYGVFVQGTGIYTDTFVLEGDRLDFAVCDVCVVLTVRDSKNEVVAEYMASGGEVDLTKFSPEDGVEATLRGVAFQQVDIQWNSGNTMEPSSTHCTTSVANGTIGGSFPPQCDPMTPATCATGSGCQYWSGLDFVCRAAGTASLGESCAYGYDCLPGLDCLDAQPWWGIPGTCVEICKDKGTCSFLATCEDFSHYLAGYCVECSETQACDSVCCEDYQACESDACVNKPCPIDSSLGEFGSAALMEPWYSSRLQVLVPSSDGSPDILQIEHRGLQPGTYTLEGVDLSLDTCTLCVTLLAFDTEGTEVGVYFAIGGTVELTSVDEGMSAILTEVDFKQVQIRNDNSMVPHPQGCSASITQATVSGTVCNSAPAQACGIVCCSASEYCNVFAETPVCVALTTPPNDTCADAVALTLDAPPVPGYTIGATADYSLPPDTCEFSWEASGSEVVYSYTPAADGTFYVTAVPGFGYNPMLWVAAGTCGDGAACTAAKDEWWGGMADSLAIEGTAGTTYYIYVDHYSGDGDDSVGVFTIAATSTAP